MSRGNDAPPTSRITPEEAAMIEQYRRLSPENKRHIQRLAFRWLQHKDAAPWRGSGGTGKE